VWPSLSVTLHLSSLVAFSGEENSPRSSRRGDCRSDVEEALDLGPAPQRRTRLPPPKEVEQSISLWSLIKSMIGKDLTRVCLPVYFNEPISALQKVCACVRAVSLPGDSSPKAECETQNHSALVTHTLTEKRVDDWMTAKVAEELEYTALLDAAAAAPKGSVDRLVLVAAFAISGYCSTRGRTSKPFNPLEKETYEFVCPENGFRMLVEKVRRWRGACPRQLNGDG